MRRLRLGHRLPGEHLVRLQLLPGRRQLSRLLLLSLLLDHQGLFPLRALLGKILADSFTSHCLLLQRRLLLGHRSPLLLQHRPFHIQLLGPLGRQNLDLGRAALGLLLQFGLQLLQPQLLRFDSCKGLRGPLLL